MSSLKISFAFLGAALLASSSALAQSSASIYGILDAGVTRVSNANGGRLALLDTGVMQASRLGYRGVEDLGGGMSALFLLEQGIILDTGASGQGGLLFGRQSWVGLSDAKLGVLTLGRQYDFMFDSLVGFINPSLSAGGYANNPLDNDRMSGQRVNNSMKYQSPVVNGFSAGALVAFSETRDSARGTGFSRSFGANYKNGPFGAGVAYTYLQGASLDIRSLVGASAATVVGGVQNEAYGIGASYQVTSQLLVHAVANRSKFDGPDLARTAQFRNIEGGVVYSPVASWRFGAAVNTTKLRDNDYRQLNLTADYILSRRTDLYVQAIHQKADGAGATANIFLLPGSSDRTQTALRVGVRHRF
ncbi:MAG: porin [Xylophilus ampelinus]